jgi:hypothetical protein
MSQLVKTKRKVLRDLESLRGSSNKKTLYSTRSFVNKLLLRIYYLQIIVIINFRIPPPPGVHTLLRILLSKSKIFKFLKRDCGTIPVAEIINGKIEIFSKHQRFLIATESSKYLLIFVLYVCVILCEFGTAISKRCLLLLFI